MNCQYGDCGDCGDCGLAGGWQAGRLAGGSDGMKQTNQWYLKTEMSTPVSDWGKDMLWLAVINTLGWPWRYLGYKTCLDSQLLPQSIIVTMYYYKLPTPHHLHLLINSGGRKERDKTQWINMMKVRGERWGGQMWPARSSLVSSWLSSPSPSWQSSTGKLT